MKPKISRYEILVLLSFSVLLCYLISVLYYVTDVGKNKCLMTYMYEYPQFVKISMADKLARLSRRYGLYAYSEGKYIERAKSMKFTGIPVLFVPGQGGSYKQVRSLASVTTHRTMDLQSIFHFDFFTISFNGELSALFGGTLRDQHEFIVHCIQKVLSLYPVPNRPKSVIIIGHSMGGMIARSLFLSSHFNPETVKLIITLATPHQPVILIDKYLRDFYNSVDTFWLTENTKSNSKLKNLTMISIGGGFRDKLVRPGLTYNRLADLNVLTNAIPDVITSTDHLCILWCNNFVKTLSRALYDAVDFDIKGITQDKNHLRNIFYYHLVHCSNGKYYTPEIHQERIKFTRNSTWKEIKQNNISLIFQYGLDEDTHIIIKKPKNSWEYDGIMIEAVNIDKRDWIAECNPLLSSSRSVYCDNGNNLSQYGTVGFNKTLNRKYFRMSFADTELFRTSLSHLVVRLPGTREETGLNVDIYNSQSRIVEVDLNFFLLYKPMTVIKETDHGALLYMLRLNNMVTMWKVYRVHLLPLQCTNEKHAAYAVFKTPWNHDSSHVIINWEEQEVLKLILLTIPPLEPDDVPQVDLILDPSCSYTVQIEASYLDSIAVITARYSLCLVGNIAAILVLTLIRQYSTIERTRTCPSFLHALTRGAVPWLIFPFVKIATFLWEYLSLKTYLGELDTQLLLQDTADGWIVPLILYFVSFALVYVIGVLLQLSISLNVWIYNQYSLGDLLSKLEMLVDEEVADIIYKVFPASLCTTILMVSWLTCEGHGFIAGLVVYYIRLCYFLKKGLSANESPSPANANDAVAVSALPVEPKSSTMDAFNLHTTLFLLWYLCALTYLPHSIMWHKNFEFDFSLREFFTSKLTPLAAQDTSFWLLAAYSVSAGCLWFCDVPHLSLPNYELFARSFYATACCLLLFCQVNVFRLPSYLMPVFLSMAGHQYSGMAVRSVLSPSPKDGQQKSDKKLSKKKQK